MVMADGGQNVRIGVGVMLRLTASPVLRRVALRKAAALLHLDAAWLAGQLLHRTYGM